jgi:hypothetical protein
MASRAVQLSCLRIDPAMESAWRIAHGRALLEAVIERNTIGRARHFLSRHPSRT